MSASSDSAAGPSLCACTNISLMQLFHELKQKFPGVPDHVVSNTIELYCHDKQACETHLHSEVKASLTHAYHASSSAAARQLNELKLNPPNKCRNQPIIKHDAPKTSLVNSSTCQGPQKAVLSSNEKVNTDANQNVVELKTNGNYKSDNTTPIAVINIDNCYAKYGAADSLSDLELTNDNTKKEVTNSALEQNKSTNYRIFKSNKIKSHLNQKLEIIKQKKTIKKEEKKPIQEKSTAQSLQASTETVTKSPKGSQAVSENVAKSSKDLQPIPEKLGQSLKELQAGSEDLTKSLKESQFVPEGLAKSPKESNVVSEDLVKSPKESQVLTEKLPQNLQGPNVHNQEKLHTSTQLEKPKRPNTLDFIKPNPENAFNPTLNPQSEPCQTVSPTPTRKDESQPLKDTTPGGTLRPERGYPLNLSVNVNCHMDLSRSYGDPWLEDYDSPRAITSVNLTVCTPTSNMASPVRDPREEDGGFAGQVTVTVSPSTARAPRRKAPPPPVHSSRMESQRPFRPATEAPELTQERSLIERQKERLHRLARALAQERGRLQQLTRETQILAAPPPAPAVAQRLRDYVERLRDQCDTLSKRLEMGSSEPEESENFYSNIYTGQRPPSSWQCHMCTFRNHPLLDKCEECDMPRIFVGTSPARTHDSGFGSFRDRNRKPGQVSNQTDLDSGCGSNIVEDICALPKLNC